MRRRQRSQWLHQRMSQRELTLGLQLHVTSRLLTSRGCRAHTSMMRWSTVRRGRTRCRRRRCRQSLIVATIQGRAIGGAGCGIDHTSSVGRRVNTSVARLHWGLVRVQVVLVKMMRMVLTGVHQRRG